MQKIAIVSPRLPMGGAVGGAETLLLNLARLAAEGGADVTFLTTCSTNRDGKWQNDMPAGESVSLSRSPPPNAFITVMPTPVR